jgi:hypothetical protein
LRTLRVGGYTVTISWSRSLAARILQKPGVSEVPSGTFGADKEPSPGAPAPKVQ